MSSSERLRIQVSTLKSLLDSDNAKVRLAMRELERLKQLLRDKDMEKAVLERVGICCLQLCGNKTTEELDIKKVTVFKRDECIVEIGNERLKQVKEFVYPGNYVY